MRGIEKIIGSLFIFAFMSYGIGFGLISNEIKQMNTMKPANQYLSATGGLLMLFNSACVICIGLLTYKLLASYNKLIAQGYLITRIFEGIFLSAGATYLFTTIFSVGSTTQLGHIKLAEMAKFAEHYNFISYQIAMTILGIGSVSFCFVLVKFCLVPKLIGLLGIIGYSILSLGSIIELYKIEIGIYCSIPGGLFEIIFAYWLIFKGFKRTRV